MATYTWPSTGRHRPEGIVEHATHLKADFDLVSDTVDASLSNATLLPPELNSSIVRAIETGIYAASSMGYCANMSDIDRETFSKLMLKNITVLAAYEARHYVPLQTTSAVNFVNTATKTSKERDLGQGSRSKVTAIQEEKAGDVKGEESGSDSSEEEASGTKEIDSSEEEESESEDAGYDQEVPGNKDNASRVDGSNDDDSDSEEDDEEDNQTNSDAGNKEEENQEIVRGEIVPNIIGDGSGFSTTVNLKIAQQVSVNRLQEKTYLQLRQCLNGSLQRFFLEQQASCVNVYQAQLLDNGDVKVFVYAKTQEALQQIIDSTGWDQHFELALTGPPVRTYKVVMHEVEINSMRFRNRRAKSAIIRKLTDANSATVHVNNVKHTIGTIYWSRLFLQKPAAALIVDFLCPEQANHALLCGLYWQGRRHNCERAGRNCKLHRCSRCQGYGHLSQNCSGPHRCGKCAGPHPRKVCKSEQVMWGSCGAGHYPGNNKCPAKAKAKESLCFPTGTVSQATKPAAEAQPSQSPRVRHSTSAARTQTETSMPSPISLDADSAEDEVKSEPDQPLPEAGPTQETHLDTATLLARLEDLRRDILAQETAMQIKTSGQTKRRAGEAFAGGAEAESSYMGAKRIKQEAPTRENSMGLYRQPSPFIVRRPQ